MRRLLAGLLGMLLLAACAMPFLVLA